MVLLCVRLIITTDQLRHIKMAGVSPHKGVHAERTPHKNGERFPSEGVHAERTPHKNGGRFPSQGVHAEKGRHIKMASVSPHKGYTQTGRHKKWRAFPPSKGGTRREGATPKIGQHFPRPHGRNGVRVQVHVQSRARGHVLGPVVASRAVCRRRTGRPIGSLTWCRSGGPSRGPPVHHEIGAATLTATCIQAC